MCRLCGDNNEELSTGDTGDVDDEQELPASDASSDERLEQQEPYEPHAGDVSDTEYPTTTPVSIRPRRVHSLRVDSDSDPSDDGETEPAEAASSQESLAHEPTACTSAAPDPDITPELVSKAKYIECEYDSPNPSCPHKKTHINPSPR
jgi:hypothetical protein